MKFRGFCWSLLALVPLYLLLAAILPPFDDELSPDVWAPAHQLAFEWPAPGGETPGPSGDVPKGLVNGSVGGVVAGARLRPRNSIAGGVDLAISGAAASQTAVAVAPGGAVAVAPGSAVAVAPGGAVAVAPGGAVAVAPGSAVAVAPGGAIAVAPGGAVAVAPGGAIAAPPGGAVAVAPSGAGAETSSAAVAKAPSGAAAGASGDAKLAVRRFVQLAVEVLNGHRPAAQLRRLAHPMDASRIVAQGVAGAHRVNQMRRADPPTERRRRRAGPVAVLRLRLCEPRPGAVEAAVLLVTGERTWAMALRLELHHDAWTATVLRLI